MAVRDPGTVRWIRRGRAYRLVRAPQRETPPVSPAVREVVEYQRAECPVLSIALAALSPFAFGLVGIVLAYLLR